MKIQRLGLGLLVLACLFPASTVRSQEALSLQAKTQIIFDYAEQCRWLSPAECSRLDPHFSEYPSVAPYRNLCQENKPSRCLIDQNVLPFATDRVPLSLDDFTKLESFISAAHSLCRDTWDSEGYDGCRRKDAETHHAPNFALEPDRRLYRQLQAGDHEQWYEFAPRMLVHYEAFCGSDPIACLVRYAPQRPANLSANSPADIIFTYAEQCRWLSPSECSRLDPHFSEYPSVTPYRNLCQENKPSRCLIDQNVLPFATDRVPLSLDDFTKLESFISAAHSLCRDTWDSEGYDGCRRKDAETHHAPNYPWEQDRRLYRQLLAGDHEQWYEFAPRILSHYEAFCGSDPIACLVRYAPQRPSSPLILQAVIPVLEFAPSGSGTTIGTPPESHPTTTPGATEAPGGTGPSPTGPSGEAPPPLPDTTGEHRDANVSPANVLPPDNNPPPAASKISGGGLGCSLQAADETASMPANSLFLLLAAVFWIWRRFNSSREK